MAKIHNCSICHKEIEKAYRINKEEFGVKGNPQYYRTGTYNVCLKCFKTFEHWVDKHKENKNE